MPSPIWRPARPGRRAPSLLSARIMSAAPSSNGSLAASRILQHHDQRGTGRPDAMTEIAPDTKFSSVDGIEVNRVPDGAMVYQNERERVHFLNPTALIV